MKKVIRTIGLTLLLLTFAQFPSYAKADDSSSALQTSSQIPYKTENLVAEGQSWNMLYILIALLSFTCIGLYAVQRFSPALRLRMKHSTRRLQVIENLRLTPRCSLYLIHVDGKSMLLANCGDNMVVLKQDEAIQSISQDADYAI